MDAAHYVSIVPLDGDDRMHEIRVTVPAAPLERRGVRWKPVRSPRHEQSRQIGKRGSGRARGALEHTDLAEAQGLDPLAGRPHARVMPLGEDDPPIRSPRPLVDAVPEAHRPNFLRNAC